MDLYLISYSITIHVQHGTNDVSGGQVGAAFAANMTLIVAAAVAAGLKVVIHDAPWRYDNLAQAESVLLNNAAQDALVNGTTVLRGDKVLTARLAARFPGDSGDGVHFFIGPGTDPAGIGCLVSYLRNVLEPSTGGGHPPIGGGVIRG